jgi:hypothetical protein
MFDDIQLDSPADLTNYINKKTLTSDDAKGIRNAFTNARITLSNILPVRNTRDRDYPLWPFIKFVRYESSNFEDDKLAILREMSDILLQNMPNYKTNNNFKEYKYKDLINLNEYNSLTELEKTFLDIMAKTKKDMMGYYSGIGLIYGNDRLIRFYINTLLRWYKEEKKKNGNTNFTSDYIVDMMKRIPLSRIIEDDYENFSASTGEINEAMKRLNKKLYESNENTNQRYTQTNRDTIPVSPPVNVSIIDEVVDIEGTPRCPSAGKNPTPVIDKKDYYRQAKIFSQDNNPGCKNKNKVIEKMQDLNKKYDEYKEKTGLAGGKRRKSKRKKTNKRRNTKRRYRK